MKILAVDDENIAREGLVSAIKEVEPSAEVYSFESAGEALEFYGKNPCEVAFLDIQIWNRSGVELAKQMKLINPTVNIIFATAYGDYRADAFDMYASGYLIKPVTPQRVRKELDNLRYPVETPKVKRVQIVTFGNFEVYVDGEPLHFRYDRSKEILAYLVDRRGAYCTNAEITAILWEDEKHISYFSNLRKDLLDAFKEKGCREVIDAGWGRMRIDKELVDCDYYEWCAGNPQGINRYQGEYMSQYSWAEITNAALTQKQETEEV